MTVNWFSPQPSPCPLTLGLALLLAWLCGWKLPPPTEAEPLPWEAATHLNGAVPMWQA